MVGPILFIKSRVIPGTPKDMGPPYGERDPYEYPISLGILMVPLLGVPENPIEV